MATQQEIIETNNELVGLIDSGHEKRAENALTAYTRTKMREGSYMDRVITPQKITFADCDRQMNTELPVFIVDKENDIPPAMTVSFGASPNDIVITAPKYQVVFNRILTYRYTKDIAELGMYHMDVRQVISDNSIRELLAEKDGRWMSAFTSAIGSIDVTHPLANAPLYKSQSGGLTRIGAVESLKGMSRTIWNLASETCLTNMVTWMEFMKWGRDEVGGDMAQQAVKDGTIEAENFLGRRWIVTIKRGQVPDDAVCQFANEKFLGKNLTLEEPTMFMKREAFFIEYFFYAAYGGAYGHIGGLFRTDHQG
jgi:hypothetical protein